MSTLPDHLDIVSKTVSLLKNGIDLCKWAKALWQGFSKQKQVGISITVGLALLVASAGLLGYWIGHRPLPAAVTNAISSQALAQPNTPAASAPAPATAKPATAVALPAQNSVQPQPAAISSGKPSSDRRVAAISPTSELKPAPPATAPKPSDSPPPKIKNHPRTQVVPGLPIPALAEPQSPVTINSAPNGFAVSGGTLDHPTVNNYAPIDRHLTSNQTAFFKDVDLHEACSPLNRGVEIWWEPTPEAASYGNDFISALGPSVGQRSPLEPIGEGYKGINLGATDWDAPSECARQVRLAFKLAGIPFTLVGLKKKWINPLLPFPPHGPPPKPEEMISKPGPPETVIFVGVN